MDNNNLNIKVLEAIFKQHPQVKLVYFFGSKTTGKSGPLSDYDFAVYLDEHDLHKRFKVRVEVLNKLAQTLHTDNIDLCVLNDIESSELKYSIIFTGKLIYEIEPYKILLEPRILSEYFDFMDWLRRGDMIQQQINKYGKIPQCYCS